MNELAVAVELLAQAVNRLAAATEIANKALEPKPVEVEGIKPDSRVCTYCGGDGRVGKLQCTVCIGRGRIPT